MLKSWPAKEYVVLVGPQYDKLYMLHVRGDNLSTRSSKQGAIPLITGGWPTKRPVIRAENVPADSSLLSECTAGMSRGSSLLCPQNA